MDGGRYPLNVNFLLSMRVLLARSFYCVALFLVETVLWAVSHDEQNASRDELDLFNK